MRKAGRLLAVIIRAEYREQGTTPFTDEAMPLQVVVMNRTKGEGVEAHVHPPSEAVEQAGRSRHEVLHIVNGCMEVGVYSREGELVQAVTLRTGDTIILTEGHSTKFLEDTRAIEVKEGVYPGLGHDKIWL